LKRTVEKSEMLEVVRDLDGDKALGPNGLSLAFFQKCWEVFFLLKKGKFEKSINATFVFLIPKKADVVDIKDFCPISWIVNFNRGNMGYCPSWI
jgi:hypothetical protein